jgi:hypothetical protein
MMALPLQGKYHVFELNSEQYSAGFRRGHLRSELIRSSASQTLLWLNVCSRFDVAQSQRLLCSRQLIPSIFFVKHHLRLSQQSSASELASASGTRLSSIDMLRR